MEGYTIKEASRELRVCQKTVHNYILRGVLKARKEYGRWIIDPESLKGLKEKKGIGDNVSITPSDKITIDKSHYEGLLKQIGQLQAKEEFLRGYVDIIEDLRERVGRLEQILSERQRRGLWGKLTRKQKSQNQKGG